MYVFQGTTLNLTCTGTGAPPPTFSWSVDGRSFDPSNARVTMMGGALMLSAVNMNDSGTYFCSAVSSAGMVASSVNVRVVPMPGDEEIVQSGTRGDAMLLDCAPGLDATNQIVWVYEMTPLTDSDKYSILDNGSLLVRDIDLEDMGIYTCLLGNISVNVSLVVQCMLYLSHAIFRSVTIFIPLQLYQSSLVSLEAPVMTRLDSLSFQTRTISCSVSHLPSLHPMLL